MDSNGNASVNANAKADMKPKFLQVYDHLKAEILADPAFDYTEDARQWVDKMLDYNVPGGKLNRGLSVIDSYRLLKKGKELSEDEVFLGCVLGWCIEWLQSYFLVLDDMMDGSHTRRGQPCWFRLPKVGLIAANDGILLRNHIPRILKRHFRTKSYYVDLLDLFNEVEFQTACGQLLDLITTHEGALELSKYKMPTYLRIVQYKTAYYSFYLPVACALLMAEENLDNFSDTKNILIQMGTYFQVQDDYLDCFGDPQTIGKFGVGLCRLEPTLKTLNAPGLVVQALERANESQIQRLHANYGKADPSCVAEVKDLYRELGIEDVFLEYENTSHKNLISSIESQKESVQLVLKSFLGKIYKRQK